MTFAAIFTVGNRESPYYLKSSDGQLALPDSYYYTGDLLTLYREYKDDGVVVARIAIAMATIMPDQALSIQITPAQIAENPRSMLVRLGNTAPLPWFSKVKVGVSEVNKL
jgi:hypothetical protein